MKDVVVDVYYEGRKVGRVTAMSNGRFGGYTGVLLAETEARAALVSGKARLIIDIPMEDEGV